MKKRFIFILTALLLLSYNSIGAYEYHEEIASVESLLNNRIKIMNDFLYGEKNMGELEYKLRKIEAEELLNNDLDILFKVIDNPTDYEMAKSVKVEKIMTLEETDDCIYINADLNWSMRGYDGEFSLIKNYDIKCKISEDNMYLTRLKYIN